jgi:WD40 repeat protein
MVRPILSSLLALAVAPLASGQVQIGDVLVVRYDGQANHHRADGSLVRTLTASGFYWGGSFLPDGDILVVRAGSVAGLMLFDGDTGAVLFDVDVPIPTPWFAHTAERLRNGEYVFDHGGPGALRLDASGTVIGSVQLAGQLLRHGSTLDGNGDFWLTSGGSASLSTILRCDQSLQIASQFFVPHAAGDLDVAPDGTLWVTDTAGSRVRHLQADGTPISAFDIPPSTLYSLHNLALTVDGSLLIAHYGSSELSRYSQAGALLGAFSIEPAGGLVCSIDVAFGTASQGSTECEPAVANSTGRPGQLQAFGSTFVSDATLRLLATDLPPSQFGVLLHSLSPSFVPMARGSQGTLCLAGPVGRQAALVGPTDLNGTLERTIDITALPMPAGFVAVAPGETWRFQMWYRDSNPASTSNFTTVSALHFR